MIMWVVQSTFRRKSQLTTPTTHTNEKCCVSAFRPVAPTHNTAQCNSSPQSTVERREEAGTTYRGPEVRNGARRSEYVAYVSVFLASIRCNLVVICLTGGICGLEPSCILRCPLRYLTFPLAGRPELALSRPAPAQHHNLPPNCRNFLPECEQRFHPRGR